MPLQTVKFIAGFSVGEGGGVQNSVWKKDVVKSENYISHFFTFL